ncbi:MAG: hypothetical protein WD038_00775 [Balneolales bacterium]
MKIKKNKHYPLVYLPYVLLAITLFVAACSKTAPKNVTDNQKEGLKETGKRCPSGDKWPVDLCDTMGKGWIFCDDFESEELLDERYFDYDDSQGGFSLEDSVGRGGSKGMRAVFDKGEVSAGNLKLAFGRHEIESIGQQAVANGQNFDEIYWHMDLCHEAGWSGGGGHKLFRSTTLLEGWGQGHIAHIWSMGGDDHHYLGMDPATGIDEEGTLASTRYNDWDNLRWLGSHMGEKPLFNSEFVGHWYSIEAHVKLNTPGKSDGIFEFWIDGELQARRDDYNWHGNWNDNPDNYGINAIFIENYWNDPGSVQKQERYFDNFVVSTKRIGNLRKSQ